MSRQPIHRIYTEDKRRDRIVRVISQQFENFTLQPATGYYRAKPEKSIVLEFVGAKESQLKWLAARIREINRQASVLVITLNVAQKRLPLISRRARRDFRRILTS
jgi:hypothetical protein